MQLQGLRQKRQEILRIANRYGARRVRVFGSVAKGQTRTGSDVDFLVELDSGRSLRDLSNLILDLQQLLGCHVDVVEPHTLHWYVRDRVLAEAVPL